jgi:hypothetical protein
VAAGPVEDGKETRAFCYELETSYTYLVFAMERAVILGNELHIEFISDPDKIKQLALESVGKIGAKATSQFFYRFSEAHPELVCQYLETLMSLADQKDDTELKQILRQFKHVMMYHSTNKVRFIRFGMDLFLKMLHKNKGFYKATELGCDIFFKMIFYDLRVHEWVMTNRLSWKWLDIWAK